MTLKLASKGYLLVVASWENDADYGATDNLQITSREELAWLLHLLPYFEESSWKKGPNGEDNYYVGNCYEEEWCYARLREIMKEGFEKYWPDNEYYKEFPEDFEPFELLYEYGNAFRGMQDGQNTRKVESYKVYAVPEDVILDEVKL